MAAVPSRPEEAACHSGAIFARSACLRRRRHTIRTVASVLASSLPRPGFPAKASAGAFPSTSGDPTITPRCEEPLHRSMVRLTFGGGRSMVACSPQEERRGECATMQGQGVWWMCVAFTSVVRSARKPKPISCLHERGVGGASFPCEASCRAHAPPQPRGSREGADD